jgi:hypothetical protein
MAADLLDRGIKFVLRLKAKQYKHIYNEIKADSDHGIVCGFRNLPARVARFMLSAGEIETLAASLSRKELGIRGLAAIYSFRWGVESERKTFKSLLGLEIFAGLDELSVRQDFFAACIQANLLGFAALDANELIQAQEREEETISFRLDVALGCKKTKRKHPQQAKLSSLASALVDYLPEFLLGIHTNLYKLTQDLILYSSTEKSPMRPGRSFERVRPHDAPCYYNYRFAM